MALGSGGARGLAHIGVLERLEELGIFPDLVAGSSMGSLVGFGYCGGRIAEMKALALGMDIRTLLLRLVDFGMPHGGLVEGRRIEALLEELMPRATFRSLAKPLRCIATDLHSGEEVVFSEGHVVPAIRASISVPGLFAPVRHGHRYLIDGGVVNPIPVDQARRMGADVVIAVDVNHGCLNRPRRRSLRRPVLKPPFSEWWKRIEREWNLQDSGRVRQLLAWFNEDPSPNLVDVLGGTIHIVENQVSQVRLKLDPPDFLLTPAVGDAQILDFHHAREIIAAGRASVDQQADALIKRCRR